MRAVLAAATVRLWFKVLREGSKAGSRIITLNLRRTGVGLFRNLGEIPCNIALEDKEDRRAGSLRMTSSECKNRPFCYAEA